MHMKLLDLGNLNKGNERQKKAFAALTQFKVFEILERYAPVLAGAIPIDVDIPSSHLDIVCSGDDLVAFGDLIEAQFGRLTRFRLAHGVFENRPSVVAHFEIDSLPVQIFAQPSSSLSQTAVLLMLVEARLLTFAPSGARERVRGLKKDGFTTVDAFTKVFGIEGEDSTVALLEIYRMPDVDILKIAHRLRWDSILN